CAKEEGRYSYGQNRFNVW
nr:immunoglobulin heavy chain junction region [Macaca mulatta]MOX00747.1 immunoglobulin heavy chain junction region [Macaca mulatta]MOX02119.1 immunoglobulin heavy chain junction region [Macaca mulatta]MOX02238.1 immunoglobulin heavy chain junction region [Macaca mulatta]MOX02602.1 immunoglobulin heavy chain junction region [Macaca mulatta]